MVATAASKRPSMIVDELLNLCHYKTDKKLLIVDQVELFGGDDAAQQELRLLLANVCSAEGQVLLGCQRGGSGRLQVILCQDERRTEDLRGLGVPVVSVHLA